MASSWPDLLRFGTSYILRGDFGVPMDSSAPATDAGHSWPIGRPIPDSAPGVSGYDLELKRNGLPVPMESMMKRREAKVLELIAQLEKRDPMQAAIVRYRYLLGLTLDETAEALEVSLRTVHRGWRRARDFLSIELNGDASGETPTDA